MDKAEDRDPTDVAREKEEEGSQADEEGVREESTSQERLDRVADPDEPGTGSPYPPKPA